MSRILLRRSGRAAAQDSKTVTVCPFEVPPGVEALALRFDYQPRTATDPARNEALVEAALEKHDRRREALGENVIEAHRREFSPLYRSLNNLLNVVLIDPQGRWRGRWDRNPASRGGALVLSPGGSSKGFLPGPITPGRWTAAVECHGVFGDPVSYELEVDETAAPAQPLAAPPLARGTRQVKSGPGWYFGELHSHTVHSDGKHELIELCSRAAALGADFLALTDHNTTSGLLERDAFPVIVVPGCELTTFHGHHPIYGLTDIVPWHREGRVLSLTELSPLVRARRGLVSVAHPFKIGDPICTGCRMPDGLDPASFDLFEVWYRAWDAPETDNPAAHALWNDFWKAGRPIIAVAARDWHGPGQQGAFPGPMPFTGVWAEDGTAEAIVEGLRRGRVILSGGPILDLSLRAADGRTARINERLEADAARVIVRVDQLDGPAQLRLFRSGDQVRSAAVEAKGDFEFEGLADRPGWYRAELWQGKLPRCITNHAVLGPRAPGG